MFTGILNRRDITPAQITTFMQMGVQYVQRKLRVPPMETTLIHTCDGTKIVPVPGDFLEAIALYTDDTTNGVAKLEKRDLQTVLQAAQAPGSPRYYYRSGGNFLLGPTPTSGTTLYVHYYADASQLVADTDSNWLTEAGPTILVYAALKYAADFFLDDRKSAFAETLGEDMSDLQEMASRDELVNGSISPLYPDQTRAVY